MHISHRSKSSSSLDDRQHPIPSWTPRSFWPLLQPVSKISTPLQHHSGSPSPAAAISSTYSSANSCNYSSLIVLSSFIFFQESSLCFGKISSNAFLSSNAWDVRRPPSDWVSAAGFDYSYSASCTVSTTGYTGSWASSCCASGTGSVGEFASTSCFGDAFGEAYGDSCGEALGEAFGDTFGETFGDVFGEALGDAFGEALGEILGDETLAGSLSRKSCSYSSSSCSDFASYSFASSSRRCCATD